MDPSALMAAASQTPSLFNMLPGLMQGATGVMQMLGGKKKLKGLERPEYKTPDEIYAANTLAAQEYGSIGRSEINANIQNDIAGANAAGMAARSGYGASAAPAIVAQQQAGNRQVQVMADQKRQQDLGTLMNMQQVLAKYKDTEFQMNKFAPYSQKYNEGREMIGAGMQNAFGGLNSMAGIMSMSGIGGGGSVGQTSSVTPGQAASITSDATSNDADFQQMLWALNRPR